MDIINKLIYIRKTKKLSQEDLANLLCKSADYVKSVESGEKELKPIIFLNFCEALKISPIEFLKE